MANDSPQFQTMGTEVPTAESSDITHPACPSYSPMDSSQVAESLDPEEAGLQSVLNALGNLHSDMHIYPTSRDSKTSFHELMRETDGLKRFRHSDSYRVGFIGDSGKGKSSLISSMLGERDIAHAGNLGKACTTVVTEFRKADPEQKLRYKVVVGFMEPPEVETLLSEYLHNFRDYHCSEEETISAEESESARKKAADAEKTLEFLFHTKVEFNTEFLKDESPCAFATIRDTLCSWANDRIYQVAGGWEKLAITEELESLKDCRDRLTSLYADSQDGSKQVLWPFIKLISVRLSASVLNTGLVLMDLPGFRDMNNARARVSEEILNHECDEVCIVEEVSRINSTQSINENIERSYGKAKTLICTKTEDVAPIESANEPTDLGRAVKHMNDKIRKFNRELRKMNRRIHKSKATNQKLSHHAKPDVTELQNAKSILKKEIASLKLERFQTLMNARNNDNEKNLKKQYEGLQFFFVSNRLYWQKNSDDSENSEDDLSSSESGEDEQPLIDQAKEYMKLSNIEVARQHFILKPTSARKAATTDFVNGPVKQHLYSLTTWADGKMDHFTEKKAQKLKALLGHVHLHFEKDFQSPNSIWARACDELKVKTSAHTVSYIHANANLLRPKLSGLVEEWRTLHHGTFRAFTKHGGSWKNSEKRKISWNEALAGEVHSFFASKEKTLCDLLREICDKLHEDINTSFEKCYQTLQEHHEIAPESIEALIGALELEKNEIQRQPRIATQKMTDAMHAIFKDICGASNAAYTTRIMLPLYYEAADFRGKNSDKRRKSMIQSFLTGDEFIDGLRRKIEEGLQEHIYKELEICDGGMSRQVESIYRDLDQTGKNYGKIPESKNYPQIVEALRMHIDKVQKACNSMDEIQRKRKRDDNYVGDEPNIKKEWKSGTQETEIDNTAPFYNERFVQQQNETSTNLADRVL